MRTSAKNGLGRPLRAAVATIAVGFLIGPSARAAAEPGRWRPVPVEGGEVASFIVRPGAVYVNLLSSEMFARDHDATAWRRLGRASAEPLPLRPQNLVLVDEPHLWALEATRLFVSSDGVTWERRFPDLRVAGIAQDAATGDLLTVTADPVTGETMLLRSEDRGDSWTAVSMLPGNPGVASSGLLTVRGSQVYFHLGSLFYRSSDGGVTWQLLFRDPAPHVVVDSGDSRVIVQTEHSVVGRRLFRSRDSGTTFEELIDFGESISDLAGDPLRPGRLLVALESRLAESLDQGATWRYFAPPVPDRFLSGAIAAGADADTVYVGVRRASGVHVSRDGGASWQAMNEGLLGVPAETAAFVADGRIVFTSWQGVHTVDGGVATLASDEWVPLFAIAVEPHERRMVYTLEPGSAVLRSADAGASWELLLDFVTAVGFAAHDGALLVGSTTIDRSRDGGATFETVMSSDQRESLGQSTSFARINGVAEPLPGRLYATLGTGLATSHDDGATWQRAAGGTPFTGLRMAVDPFDPDRVLVWTRSWSGESVDGGTTLDDVDRSFAGITRLNALLFDPSVPGRLYAGGDAGVERSADGGASWQPMSEGLVENEVVALALDPARPTQLLAGTARGLYVRSLATCTPTDRALCIDDAAGDRRFEVSMRFATDLGGGIAGDARTIPLTPLGVDRGGLLHFGNAANPESVVKILDGCQNNGHFWIFASTATTLGYELTVRDLVGVSQRVYRNPDGQPAGAIADTRAFATCDSVVGEALRPRNAAPSAPAPTARRSPHKGGSCVPDDVTLCIDDQPGDRRFAVRMAWHTAIGGGLSGEARAVPLATLGVDRGGLLHFGHPANPEVLVKVLDGCQHNDRFWVFFSAATTLGFELEVVDTRTGEARTYPNADGTSARAVADTQAFATCLP